jgi:uncharacterized protein (DUF983 family)
MPDRSRCPNCGERVSPFAAGCAVCGADLDHRRWDSGPSTVTRVGSWFSALSFGREHKVPGLILLFLIFFGGSFLAWISGLFG